MMYTYNFAGVLIKRGDTDNPNREISPENPEYLQWLAEGNTPDPVDPPTLDELKAQYSQAIQAHIDATAQSKGYDSALSCVSYAADVHPPFAQEAQAFISWRSEVWIQANQDFAAFEAGTLQMPNSPQDYIMSLPTITWPN